MKDGRRTHRGEARAAELQRVRKRDGREVPFDRRKIRDAIAAAMDAVGDDDPVFADEVAGVVELALRDRVAQAAGAYVPTIEDIQDFVERALMDLGRAAVAKAYILYRDRRARLRQALRVHERVRGPLRVREAEGVSEWSKGRIVAALLSEAELSRPQAEDVAAAVERRVFASGWKRISTGLVRELVASELFERGWTHALRRQETIGLGRRDLRALVDGTRLAPWEQGERERRASDGVHSGARSVGGELLSRFTLEDVLPEELAELHRTGDLHVEDLRAADRPLALSIEAELLAGGGAEAPWQLLRRAAELARGVGHALVLENPGPVLAGLTRSGPDRLQSWFQGLAAVACASDVRVDLSHPAHTAAALDGEVLDALNAPLAADELVRAPRLYVSGHALEELCAFEPERGPVFEELFAAGRLWSTWGDEDEHFVAPGCHRRAGERGALACLGAVALNLPRLARRAGAWREDLFLAGLAELVRAAVAVGGALSALQERSRAVRGLGLHARPSLALTPVGLREALFVLGDGTLDPDQGARLLGLLAEAADRFGAASAVPLVPTPFFGERAARRFAWLDARRAADEGGRQHWLFAEAQEADELTYTTGFALGLPAGDEDRGLPGRPEAEALRTLRAGAFTPRDHGTTYSHSARGAEPHLARWKRFELMRRSHAGEIELELFPSPRQKKPRDPRPAPLRPLR